MRKRCGIKVAGIVLAIMWCICIVLTSITTVAAAEESQTELLSLNRKNPDENVSFTLKNMFPGDCQTGIYRLNVSYKGTVNVFFQVLPDSEDGQLAEVLEVTIRLANTDEILYLGSIAEMPVLKQVLITGSEAKTEELTYKITVSLGTDVGNEYQDKTLTVDFNWWAEGSDSTNESTGSTEGPTEEPVDKPTEGASGANGELVDPPDTGDHQSIMIWMICIVLALAVMMTGMYGHHRRMLSGRNVFVVTELENRQIGVRKKRKKFWLITITLLFILIAFCITSMALIYQKVSVDDNLFQTGEVNICLNDDRPVFDEEILFEPGMRIVKTFTLRNDSTCDVYYRLYFAAIEGDFAKALEIEVKDGEKILFSGKMAEMNGEKSEGADGMLLFGETRNLSITFYVPENCGNLMQNQTLLFDLNADAVQAVNNPSEKFD